ncbi:NagC family transcriptional regulator [Clostridia bacterium]|nr:NagC family transcriptional regulator [Clostridia bacterium]
MISRNQSSIVKILQKCDICSRSYLAKETGLTNAAITKLVAGLIEMGIVVETGIITNGDNRRSIGLKLNAEKYQVIGVKFARQMFSVGVFDISGEMYHKTKREYSLDDDPQKVIADIKKLINSLLETYKNVTAIGIAVPGPYLRNEGRIAVVTRMAAWRNVNFIDEFKEAFGIPVFIEHDANAGALAEWLFGGYEQSIHSLVYFLVGDGVGSGIIENEHILRGTQGAASEIGHISIDAHGPRCECGNYGCLELYCRADAMLKKANLHDCDAVFEAARKGDKKALDAVKETAEYIGYGCVTLINAYNPNVIAIGDIMSQGGDLLLPIILDTVKQRVIPELYDNLQIKITELAVDPILYGAAALATREILKRPSEFSGEFAADLSN